MPVPTHQGRKWTVLADIKTVKPNHTREEKAAFVLKDLGVPPTSIAAAYVLHVDQLFLISLRDGAAYEIALERSPEECRGSLPAAGGSLVTPPWIYV